MGLSAPPLFVFLFEFERVVSWLSARAKRRPA
jgi:hypothetical protein